MGAVHGVYIKYVCLSTLSYVGYNILNPHDAASTEEKTNQLAWTMIRIFYLVVHYRQLIMSKKVTPR